MGNDEFIYSNDNIANAIVAVECETHKRYKYFSKTMHFINYN